MTNTPTTFEELDIDIRNRMETFLIDRGLDTETDYIDLITEDQCALELAFPEVSDAVYELLIDEMELTLNRG